MKAVVGRSKPRPAAAFRQDGQDHVPEKMDREPTNESACALH